MNKKKKTAVIAAFVVLGVAVVGLAVSVYAKYMSTLISGNGTASVAVWAFDDDNMNGTITCEPDDYDEDTLVDDKIAPGTSGKCTLIISNASSEVGVNYTIKPKTVSDKPTNLKFYKDEAHTKPFSASATEMISSEEPLAPGAAARNVYIYWYWPYETGTVTDGKAAGDDTDTEEGVAAKTMTMSFEITGVQVEPVAE